MKIQSKLYLFGILLFIATSCNKDDNPVITGSIVGQWRMTDIHADDGVSEITFLGQMETGTYTFHGTDYNTSTTFTENPNEFSSTGSYTVIADYVFQGLHEHDSLNVYAYPGTGSWSINGNKLTQILLVILLSSISWSYPILNCACRESLMKSFKTPAWVWSSMIVPQCFRPLKNNKFNLI